MDAIIWFILGSVAFVIVFGLGVVALDKWATAKDEREAAELKAWEDSKVEQAKQAQRINRAKRRLDAQATAAEELIKEAVHQPGRERQA